VAINEKGCYCPAASFVSKDLVKIDGTVYETAQFNLPAIGLKQL